MRWLTLWIPFALPAFSRTPSSVAHEFGHAFGKLLDEYVAKPTDRAFDNKTHIFDPISNATNPDFEPVGDGNCFAGNPPYSGWANQNPPVVTGDYRQGCAYQNWFTSSQNSIMKAVVINVAPGQGTNCYNSVSQSIINRRLDELVGPFSSPVPIFPCPITGGTPVVPSVTVASTPSVVTPTFVCGGSTHSVCPTPTQIAMQTSPQPSAIPSIGSPGGNQGPGFFGTFLQIIFGLFILFIRLLIGG